MWLPCVSKNCCVNSSSILGIVPNPKTRALLETSLDWTVCSIWYVGITSFGHFLKHPRRLNILLLEIIESSRESDILNFCSFRGRYLCHGVRSVYQPASTELLLISISTIWDVFSGNFWNSTSRSHSGWIFLKQWMYTIHCIAMKNAFLR